MTRSHCFLLILILALGLSSQAEAASCPTPVPLIVQISPTISIDTVVASLQTTVVCATVIDSIPSANTYLLQVGRVPSPAAASQLGIQAMELNKSVTLPRFALCGVSSLPVSGQCGVLQLPPRAAADWYKLQPALQLINAAQALPVSTGRGVVVADINSHVDYAHSALAGHLTSGYDFISARPAASAVPADQSDAGFLEQADAGFLEQSDAGFLEQSDAGFLEQFNPAYLDGLNPAYSHGSLSAGLIAAIAPDSMIMPLHAFDDDGKSDLFTLAKAMCYAVDHGAQIINLNFDIDYRSLAVESAVQFAQNRNVLLVAPAGNIHTSQPQYPAALNGVISVAATDLSDVRASFSNYGSYVFAAAPGVGIISAYPGNYYGIASGTSLSAAAVAGTAALVRSLRTNGVSDSIARAAVNIDSRNPTYQNQLGYGRIDAFGAVMSSLTPTTTSIGAPTITYNANGFVTVTVASAAGTPTGNVKLTVDNNAPPLSAALNNGTAVFTIPSPKAGDHPLTASYAAQGHFAASLAAGSLHVDKATPVISWNNPAPIEYATPLSATQLNATASGPPNCVAGAFTYSPPAGTVPTLGPGPSPQNFYPWTLSATFAPGDTTNCNAPAVKQVTIIVQDTIPPVTSITSQNPAPNWSGWSNTDVTVGLTALETPYIGSGVKNITVTLSGALTATSVVNGNTATVAITTSGTTTITYFATDNVGNKETAKTLVVKVDKTNPEAFNQFDAAAKTVKVFARAPISGAAHNPIGVCTPSTTGNDTDKNEDHPDNNRNTQVCTYTITNLAGSKLVLVGKVSSASGDSDTGDGKGNNVSGDSNGPNHEVQTRIISTQYNNGAVINASNNLNVFTWTVNKTGDLQTLTQTMIAGNGKTRQKVVAHYYAKLNQTWIIIETPGQSGNYEGKDDKAKPIVKTGLALLHAATSNGTLVIEY